MPSGTPLPVRAGQVVSPANLGGAVTESDLDVQNGEASLHVLLVGQHQDGDAIQSLTRDHLLESSLGLRQPLLVRGINDIDDAVALRVVLVPQRLHLLLPP